MPKASQAIAGLPPQVLRLLEGLAADLKTARLRRRITVRDMAERLFVSPGTVVRLEKGDATIRLGIFLTAAWVLGFDRKLADVFDALRDESGLKLELAKSPKRADAGIPRAKRKIQREHK